MASEERESLILIPVDAERGEYVFVLATSAILTGSRDEVMRALLASLFAT